MYTLLVYFVFEESSARNLKRTIYENLKRTVYEIRREQCTNFEENNARNLKRTMHEI